MENFSVCLLANSSIYKFEFTKTDHQSKHTMNKPLITVLIVLCSLLSNHLFAQEFEIKGSIVDNTDKTPLESATVYLQTLKDSTLITYTISDKKDLNRISKKSL